MEKVATILFLIGLAFSLTCIVINVMRIFRYERERRELLNQLSENQKALRKAVDKMIEEAKKE